jgi:hypothetical protein
MVKVEINKRMMGQPDAFGAIFNDVTLGKYTVSINETPLSASFASAQFEEAMALFEKLQAVMPPQLVADILIDLSSLPRKDEIKQRMQAAMGMGQPGMPPGAPPPGASAPLPGQLQNAPTLAAGVAPGGNVVPIQPGGPGRIVRPA